MRISFSIIMPTYNRAGCIKNAIDSLLAQTYNDFELIIIDDGSTDNTEEYVRKIYDKDIESGKIKLIRYQKNKGAAFARNRGLEVAENDWIGYLDSDNKMHDDFLETFVDNIKKNPKTKVFYAKIKNSNSQIEIGHEFEFDELTIRNFIDLGAFIHSIDIFKEVGGFNTELSRLIDWDLIIKYTERYKPKFIEKVLLDYYDGSEFSRITNNVSHDENYKKIIIDYQNRIPAEEFVNKYKKVFQKDLEIAVLAQLIQQKNPAISSLYQSIKQKNDEIKQAEQLIQQKDQEINFIRSSKFWKLRDIYLNIKNKLKLK
jgi:glycosyltransferase involved in cell wall biosynthesis